jgi:hypothetical protein
VILSSCNWSDVSGARPRDVAASLEPTAAISRASDVLKVEEAEHCSERNRHCSLVGVGLQLLQLPIGISPVHEPQCQLINHVVRVLWSTSHGRYQTLSKSLSATAYEPLVRLPLDIGRPVCGVAGGASRGALRWRVEPP